MILQSSVFVRPPNKLNILYLHLPKTNGHQTWQGGDLPWEASPINLHKTLNIWSGEAMQQIKIYLHNHNAYGRQT